MFIPLCLQVHLLLLYCSGDALLRSNIYCYNHAKQARALEELSNESMKEYELKQAD